MAKQQKSAHELVALIKKDLKTRLVSLEVFGHRYDGWYATALPAGRSGGSAALVMALPSPATAGFPFEGTTRRSNRRRYFE